MKTIKLLSFSIDDDGHFSTKCLIKKGKKWKEKIFKGSKAILISKKGKKWTKKKR